MKKRVFEISKIGKNIQGTHQTKGTFQQDGSSSLP